MSTKNKSLLKVPDRKKALRVNLQVLIEKSLFDKASKLKADKGHFWSDIVEAGLKAYIGEKS